MKIKNWDLDDVNATNITSFDVGMISPTIAQSIGITGATDWFQVIRIPWDQPYPSQILLTSSGQQKMYYRACSNGTWETPKQLLTNADIDGHLYLNSTGATAIESGSGSTRYRMQLNTNGVVMLYKSTDGGSSWPESKTIASFT